MSKVAYVTFRVEFPDSLELTDDDVRDIMSEADYDLDMEPFVSTEMIEVEIA